MTKERKNNFKQIFPSKNLNRCHLKNNEVIIQSKVLREHLIYIFFSNCSWKQHFISIQHIISQENMFFRKNYCLFTLYSYFTETLFPLQHWYFSYLSMLSISSCNIAFSFLVFLLIVLQVKCKYFFWLTTTMRS